jgi:hypothetical protein
MSFRPGRQVLENATSWNRDGSSAGALEPALRFQPATQENPAHPAAATTRAGTFRPADRER